MKRTIACLACLCALPVLICGGLKAQSAGRESRKLWISLSAGAMNCLTDLGGTSGKGKGFIRDLNYNATRACIGISAAASLSSSFRMRIQLLRGSLTAYDSVLSPSDYSAAHWRYQRNLHFQTRITEISLAALYYPAVLRLMNKNSGGRLRNDLTVADEPRLIEPYIAAGIALFHFNPRTLIADRLITLRDLHTEGQGFAGYPQRKQYNLFQLAIPLCAGVRYSFSAAMEAALEIGYRLLLTDYLDDTSGEYADPASFYDYFPAEKAALAVAAADRRRTVLPGYAYSSARGNPNANDAYFTATVAIALQL